MWFGTNYLFAQILMTIFIGIYCCKPFQHHHKRILVHFFFFFFLFFLTFRWIQGISFEIIYIYIIYISSLMHRDGSSVMFPLGLWRVSGLATSDLLTRMTQLALILLQLPSRQLTCASTQGEKKMTTEKALYIILQQPIRAKLFLWLLNLSFKIGRPLYSCFSAAMTSLLGYLFTPVCISSFFLFFSLSLSLSIYTGTPTFFSMHIVVKLFNITTSNHNNVEYQLVFVLYFCGYFLWGFFCFVFCFCFAFSSDEDQEIN